MNDESCDLSDVSYLVLDEADRMLDQGFERDVRKIIAATHVDRQTCLFSATWPDSVRELAHEFLKNPLKITIGSDDLTAAATIEQIVEVFDNERLRQGKLVQLLKNHKETGKGNEMKRVLVFVLYKKEAWGIEEFLARQGWKVTSVHGDKSQAARQKAVDDFKAGKVPILIGKLKFEFKILVQNVIPKFRILYRDPTIMVLVRLTEDTILNFPLKDYLN